MSKVLWIVQGLLAVVFLFAGGMKLVLPAEVLTAQFPGSALFVRFIGVAEVLGALGLLLPGLLRIRVGLTPLAAAGLAVIMTGATAITLAGGGGAPRARPPRGGGPPAPFAPSAPRRRPPPRGPPRPAALQPAS